ncbi:neprilysin-2-like [Brevipalpus obovatus]|uniref:neprilysin-2-like n=1 Tax=Brevipalpus obovatus TaxID=246614 RepID=UPI003D9F52EE
MSGAAIDLNQNSLDKNDPDGTNRQAAKQIRSIGHNILTIMALLFCIVLILYIFLHKHEDLADETCLTPGCIEAASRIIQSLDTSVDPCENFYLFSCGGWINRTILPHGRKRIGTLNLIQEMVNNKLRVNLNHLMENIRKLDRNSFEYKLVNLHRTCLNVAAIEARGNQPLLKILTDLGGWLQSDPLPPPSENVQLDVEILKLKRLGFSYNFLISIDVGPDLKNTSNSIIALDQAELALKHRNLYTQQPYLTSYASFIIASAQRLGVSVSHVQQNIYGIVTLEALIANITTPPEMRRDYSRVYQKKTLQELQNFAPNINWSSLLSGLVNKPLSPDQEVIMFDSNFIEKLNVLIPQIELRAFHNYMVWRVIYEMMPFLTKEWRDSYNMFHEGQKSEKPRWEECLDFMMDNGMDVALSSLYVTNHCDPETKEMATMAFKYIRKEFVKIIEATDWMGENTKKMAMKKVEAMEAHIAYPEEILDHNKVDLFYGQLDMDTNDFSLNMISLKKWHKKLELDQLNRSTRELWWKHTVPAVVNAFYNPLENKIQLPAALLQGVFFDKDRPYYLNFASFGFLIGHEITHGFDERGKQFDEMGNLHAWWDSETDKKFQQKIQCMVSQYDNYTLKDINMSVSGLLSKGENLADNGGLKLALKAYESWSSGKSREPNLPGLPYSPDKLFWIGAASFWCEKQTRTALQYQLLRDEHSPAEFRVIGPVSNMPEFAESFNCPIRSKMNPDEKCSVW